MTHKIIKENIVKLEQPMLEAICEKTLIDYEDKIDNLNNTIDNLQSSTNALTFNQLQTMQSKEIHEGITQAISDPAITGQVEGAESQQKVFSTSTLAYQKNTYALRF